MLRAMGSRPGQEDSSAFLKFSKTMSFSRKSIHTKLREFVYLFAFPRDNKEKQHGKNFAVSSRPVTRGKSPFKIYFAPPGKYVVRSLKILDIV